VDAWREALKESRRGKMPYPFSLFADAEPPPRGERFDELLRSGNVVVRRIVSAAAGSVDAPGSEALAPELYVQEEDEWVLLARGAATLEMDGERLDLRPGDHLFIPARTPHRVLATAAGTVWVAVHVFGQK
jgi:cupin 2 domain-containing protein